jgi:hypothetical protein
MVPSRSKSGAEGKRDPLSRKVIITNGWALEKKYGTRTAEVRDAMDGLIRADSRRGLETILVEVDKRSQMKKFKAPHVQDFMSCRENKEAIDAVYVALLPEYILILGGRDVVPHNDAHNPVYGSYDPDRYAYGDLAYASDAPYSQNPESFIGPTRIVGRIPDIQGSDDPSYVCDLLHTAARWSARKIDSYTSHFAISTYSWRKSSALTIKRLFGSAERLRTCPPDTYKWKRSSLSAMSHFINCHGAPADFRYYGEKGNKYPVAHDAAYIDGKIKEGTVVAAECCYGAELYDPRITEGQPGIPLVYLQSGAYGFFGSSTIAYGPAEGNGAADLICRYFLSRILEGASIGRAALMARQDFVDANPTLDPIDLKTLAQFVLLGDPSIHPVEPSGIDVAAPGPEDELGPKILGLVADRANRRRHLARRGLMIGQAARYARKATRIRPSPALRKRLEAIASQAGIADGKIVTYRVGGAALPGDIKAAFAAAKQPSEVFHVIAGGTRERPSLIPDVIVLVARVEAGELRSYRILRSR